MARWSQSRRGGRLVESVHFQASVNYITRSCFLPWTAGAKESTLSSAKKRLEGALLLLRIGVADTFWLFIFTLNRAKNRFNSIFNSKLNQKYSFKTLFIQIGKINSKNYSIQNWIKNIHSNWKNNLSLRKQWKTCKMGRFFLKTHFLFIFLMNIALFWYIQKFIQ